MAGYLAKISAAALLTAIALPAAARSATDVFVQAPDTVLPLFTKNQRMDMVDYHRYNLPTQVGNRLGGSSRMVESDESSALIQVGAASQIQLAILPQRSDTLVAVIETVLTPQADSGVRFYRLSDWKLLPQSNSVAIGDFITDRSATDLPDIFFCQIKYDSGTKRFVFTNTTRGYYRTGDTPAGLEALATTVDATFDGRRWKTMRR